MTHIYGSNPHVRMFNIVTISHFLLNAIFNSETKVPRRPFVYVYEFTLRSSGGTAYNFNYKFLLSIYVYELGTTVKNNNCSRVECVLGICLRFRVEGIRWRGWYGV